MTSSIHITKLYIAMRRAVSFLLIMLFSTGVFSQDLEKEVQDIEKEIEDYYNKEVATSMDTSFIDYQIKTWSLRLFTTRKIHSFSIFNSTDKLRYTPNNTFSMGLGFAYYPVLIDIGFNIVTNKEQQTQRFDFQGDVLLRENYFGLIAQRYQGFDASYNGDQIQEFRSDISSTILQVSHAYMFNSKRFAIGSVLSGFYLQKKSVGSFFLGGFANYYSMKADSSITSGYSDFPGMTDVQTFGLGISGGYAHTFVFAKNWFVFGSISPGLGLEFKRVQNADEGELPVSDISLYRLAYRVSIGYSKNKFYAILSSGNDVTTSSFPEGVRGSLNTGKTKLVFGYKFRKGK